MSARIDTSPEAVAEEPDRVNFGHPDGADMLEAFAARVSELEAELDKAWSVAHAATERGMAAEAREAKLRKALEKTRIVLAEHEPHPLPVLGYVLAALQEDAA